MLQILKTRKAKIIAVILVVVVVVGAKPFLTLAQSMIDSFTDTLRIASTWNAEVNTGTGEVKLAARSCDNGVWFCSDTAVCPNILGDGSGLLVKRTNETAQQWKTSNTACDKPHCGTDGGQDGDNLLADNTVNYALYRARDICKAAGGRLPTVAELGCMYTNRTTFGDNFWSSLYWSSTENSAAYAWGVNFSSGGTSYSDKTGTYVVRCVRGW